MNLPTMANTVDTVQHSMRRFEDETGSFKGWKQLSSSEIEVGIGGKKFALQFENVTLDLDLFTNEFSSEQYIKGFDLKENFA